MDETPGTHTVLLETIRIANGKFLRLELHHERLTRSSLALGRRALHLYEIETALAQAYYSYTNSLSRAAANSGTVVEVPGTPGNAHSAISPNPDRLRCRLSSCEIIKDIDILPYAPRRPKVLVLCDASGLDYSHKYADRTRINGLKEKAIADAKRDLAGKFADEDWDVLFFCGSAVSDTSYTNIVWQTEGENLLTPENPLLEGVRRKAYLSEGRIAEAPVRIEDLIGQPWDGGRGSYRLLPVFGRVYLINAMLDLEDEIVVEWIAAR